MPCGRTGPPTLLPLRRADVALLREVLGEWYRSRDYLGTIRANGESESRSPLDAREAAAACLAAANCTNIGMLQMTEDHTSNDQ